MREAHPGENFPYHTSFEQKLRHARKLKELEHVRIPILVDDLDGTMHKAYGLRPNMIYLLDREGIVVYKSDWTDSHELREMCESLLRLDAMKAQNVPILRQGYSERLHWIDMDPAFAERAKVEAAPGCSLF